MVLFVGLYVGHGYAGTPSYPCLHQIRSLHSLSFCQSERDGHYRAKTLFKRKEIVTDSLHDREKNDMTQL